MRFLMSKLSLHGAKSLGLRNDVPKRGGCPERRRVNIFDEK